MDLRLGTAMSHRSQQAGIDSGQSRQRPGIELIIFSTIMGHLASPAIPLKLARLSSV